MGAHRRERRRNFWKIYAMQNIHLFVLERVLDYIIWKRQRLNDISAMLGGEYFWPQRQKFVIRLFGIRFYIWVSVDRRELQFKQAHWL